MEIKKNFKELILSTKVDYAALPMADQEYEKANKAFYTEYEKFKEEHNLKNMYFSKVVSVHEIDQDIVEVCYIIIDLYLEYLNLVDEYPYGADYKPHVIKEAYLYNTPEEWLFRDSMFEALRKEELTKQNRDYSVFKGSMFEGITEIIRLSDPSNGLPGMIVERTPVTREELKNGKLNI